MSGTTSAATITFSDGLGGTFTKSNVNLTGAVTSIDVTISGGVNDGATVTFVATSAGLTNSTGVDVSAAGTFEIKIRGAYNAPREAKFDVRPANTGQTADLETKQLVDATDANNLTVQLNETNTSTVTVVSQNVRTDGQGLRLDFAQNGWNDRSDIDNAIKQLDSAKLTLRSASTNLSTNLNIIQTRESYTKEFSDVLTEGANKLVQADQNEEGANILTLQTKQQLGTIALSLANQAQQAILRLF